MSYERRLIDEVIATTEIAAGHLERVGSHLERVGSVHEEFAGLFYQAAQEHYDVIKSLRSALAKYGYSPAATPPHPDYSRLAEQASTVTDLANHVETVYRLAVSSN